MTKIRIAVLVSHPIQYFAPVYRELARRADIDLTVIYRTRVGIDAFYDPEFGQTIQWDIPLLDGYRSCFLSDKTSLAGFEPGIVKELFRQHPDVLMVHGYNSLTNLLAIAVAKLMGTRILIRGDTRLQAHHLVAPFRKRLFKQMLFKIFDGFLAIGSLNREYYLSFGVQPERIFFAPFCVSNELFAVVPEAHAQQRCELRAALNLASDCLIVLSASKLIKLKRIDELICAFAGLTEMFPAACLVIAGSGDQEDNLRQLAESLHVRQIRFIGFQNQSQLPSLYAASDIFVLPSHLESWGLILNEVMASGLPVIVSSEVGAAPDLVEGKGTGIVYPCGDVKALAASLESLLKSEALRLEMGTKARILISDWDIAACTSGITAAAAKLIG